MRFRRNRDKHKFYIRTHMDDHCIPHLICEGIINGNPCLHRVHVLVDTWLSQDIACMRWQPKRNSLGVCQKWVTYKYTTPLVRHQAPSLSLARRCKAVYSTCVKPFHLLHTREFWCLYHNLHSQEKRLLKTEQFRLLIWAIWTAPLLFSSLSNNLQKSTPAD